MKKTLIKRIVFGSIMILICMFNMQLLASAATTYSVRLSSSTSSAGGSLSSSCYYNKVKFNSGFTVTSLNCSGFGDSYEPRIYNSALQLLGNPSATPIRLEENQEYWIGYKITGSGGPNGSGPPDMKYGAVTQPNTITVSGTTTVTVLGYSQINSADSAPSTLLSGRNFNITINGTICPSIPTLISPVNNTYTNNATPSFTGVVTNGSPALVKLYVQYSPYSDFSSGVQVVESAYSASGATVSATPSVNLAVGQWYWRAKAVNTDGLESGWTSALGFFMDRTAPSGSISIASGASYATSASVMLGLSASDTESGMDTMRFSEDNATWSSWVAYSTSASFTLSSAQGSKMVYVQFKDKSGNISTYSDSIILDNQSPTGSILINNSDQYANSLNVSLSLSNSDAGSGATTMQISKYSNFSDASWIPIATYANILLDPGDGIKTVYYKVKDNVGNISPVYTDSIILDTIAPSGSIKVSTPGGLGKTTSVEVILTVFGTDERSGLSGVKYSNDNVSWTALSSLSSPKSWTLTAGSGTKIVYMKLLDNAGNENLLSGSIFLTDDVAGPTVTMTIENNAGFTTSSNVNLLLSALDNYSMFSEMKMRFSNDGFLWSPWEPFAILKMGWSLTSSTYGGNTGEGTKAIYVQVVDPSENLGFARTEIDYGTNIPTGSINTSSGVDSLYQGSTVKFVNNPKVTLGLNFTNAKEMRISLDGVTFSPWIPYASNHSINLLKYGLNAVSVQARNSSRAESLVASYEFVLDTVPPVVEVKPTNGATATSSSSISFFVMPLDNISTDNFQYKINTGNWLSLPTDSVVSATGLTNGYNQIVISIKDQAGNIGKKTISIWRI